VDLGGGKRTFLPLAKDAKAIQSKKHTAYPAFIDYLSLFICRSEMAITIAL
jgi:hypothetical protein